MYIFMRLFGRLPMFSSSPAMTVALYLPTLELSAPTPPIVDMCFETDLMKIFPWTV